jgi:hypothetical protein
MFFFIRRLSKDACFLKKTTKKTPQVANEIFGGHDNNIYILKP